MDEMVKNTTVRKVVLKLLFSSTAVHGKVYLDWGVRVGGAGGEGAVLSLGIEDGGRRGGELREILS